MSELSQKRKKVVVVTHLIGECGSSGTIEHELSVEVIAYDTSTLIEEVRPAFWPLSFAMSEKVQQQVAGTICMTSMAMGVVRVVDESTDLVVAYGLGIHAALAARKTLGLEFDIVAISPILKPDALGVNLAVEELSQYEGVDYICAVYPDSDEKRFATGSYLRELKWTNRMLVGAHHSFDQPRIRMGWLKLPNPNYQRGHADSAYDVIESMLWRK